MKISDAVEQYRYTSGYMRSDPGEDYGVFLIPGPCGRALTVIMSSGMEGIDWEHVSVSTPKATPNWAEMCFIKDMFFDAEETVMQLHPPKSRWINNHAYCLHLWRPKNEVIPLPPSVTVGDAALGTLVK